MPISPTGLEDRLRRDVAFEDRLVIEPLLGGVKIRNDKAEAASIDFHLGTRFVFLRRGRFVLHDPIEQKAHAEAYGNEIFIPLGSKLLLHPGQVVLGTTLEWYRFPRDLMAYVIGRSIWGRRGLLVVTASAVQPQTSGTITLELANIGDVAVVIRPGMALGQLFFHGVTPPTVLGKRPPFSVTHRPIFGEYTCSAVEEILLKGTARSGLDEARDDNESFDGSSTWEEVS
jgi:dCTP deaminase